MKINNEKFTLLYESLKAIKDNNINILTLVGSPGMGKTFTILEYLKGNGVNYAYLNSYSSPLSFYKLLYQNRDKEVIIFDDTHGINNSLTLSLLRSASWVSDGKKVVSYYSTTDKLKDLPESFEFNANVILIFNRQPSEYDSITNRGLTIQFDFSFEGKMKIFEEVQKDANLEEDVLNYIKETCDESTMNLSIRTLVILSKLKRSKQDFELFAKEMLKPDENKKLLIEMTCKEWTTKTGFSRASYFRHKHKHKLNEKSLIVS